MSGGERVGPLQFESVPARIATQGPPFGGRTDKSSPSRGVGTGARPSRG